MTCSALRSSGDSLSATSGTSADRRRASWRKMPALADRAARGLPKTPWRFGNWLSAHYPFVWRTRALFVVALGLLASAGATAYALRWAVRRETLPTLEASLSFLWTWAIVAESAVLLLVVDVVRRARPIVARAQLARLAACVGVSSVALMIPEYVFINAYVAHIASLETDAALTEMF